MTKEKHKKDQWKKKKKRPMEVLKRETLHRAEINYPNWKDFSGEVSFVMQLVLSKYLLMLLNHSIK